MSRARGGSALTTVPPMTISPLLMSSSPAIIRSSVLLPQPDGPTNTTNSPDRISRSMPWITAVVPYDLATLRSVTSAIGASLGRAGLREPGVDDQVMTGDAARLVGREEERGARDVVLGQAELEALLVEELAHAFGRIPQRFLARRVDRARDDRS